MRRTVTGTTTGEWNRVPHARSPFQTLKPTRELDGARRCADYPNMLAGMPVHESEEFLNYPS